MQKKRKVKNQKKFNKDFYYVVLIKTTHILPIKEKAEGAEVLVNQEEKLKILQEIAISVENGVLENLIKD